MSKVIELLPLYQPSSGSFVHEPIAVAIALVKNEGDIIPVWLSHVCELFDLIYIVDHQSSDGTREFLLNAASYLGKIHLFSFDNPGYFQSEITNKLAQMVAEKYPNTWLFPLDADEFLSVSSKSEFISSLNNFEVDRVLLLNWQNCVPMHLLMDREVQIDFPCFIPSEPGLFNKVAVSSNTFMKMKWKFMQGNHGLETETGGRAGLNVQAKFLNMIHIPIRNIDHFALKCIQGHIAYSQLSKQRDVGMQGSHWHQMISSVLKHNMLDPDIIRGFVKSYGRPDDLRTEGASIYDLVDTGWNATTFNVVHGYILNSKMSRRKTFIQLASQMVEGKSEYLNLQSFLQIIIESQKRALDVSSWQQGSNSNDIRFNKLPDLGIQRPTQECSDMELLQSFISNSFIARENPVPSTWESHIPFLYCLLKYFNPRRFVELGTHHGNCFFAACQISRQLSHTIDCIAIDTWAGDVHTGSYENRVFAEFMHILKRDYQHAKYIRKLFSDAAEQFEPESIDLLHIDGLHTYEAASEDFTTWLPKLSNRGIIMFHDTQERAREFGVWKLWAEVSRKYPSFEFEHGHGLGVLLVGEHPELHIQKLFEIAAQPETLKFLRLFFSSVGQRSPMTIKS